MKIEGTIRLPRNLVCQQDVLGTEHEFVVDSISGTIAFPNVEDDTFNKEGDHRQLVQPKNASYAPSMTEDSWGTYYNGPKGLFIRVNQLQIWWYVETQDKTELRINAVRFQASFHDWFWRFIDHLEIITDCLLFENYLESRNLGYINLTFLDEDHKVINGNDFTFVFKTEGYKNPPSLSQLKEALEKANCNVPVPLEYIYLRDARIEQYGDRYRKAILDAASAVEISLTNAISKHLGTKAEAELERDKTLKGRIKLAREHGLSLPYTRRALRKNLVDPRNAAIHQGINPTQDVARLAIDIAAQILRLHSL